MKWILPAPQKKTAIGKTKKISGEQKCIERIKSSKEKYFEYYDDIKLTPKDDW